MYPMWPCLDEIFASWLGWNTRLKQWELRLYRLLFHVPCTVTLQSHFSLSGFLTANLSRWSVLIHCNLASLSSGVSTAKHSRWSVLLCCMLFLVGFHACWLVLVCCNLQSLSSEFSAARLSLTRCNLVSLSSEVSFPFFCVLFRCKVACLSLAV